MKQETLYTIAIATIIFILLGLVVSFTIRQDKLIENCEPIVELQTLLCGEDLEDYQKPFYK